MASTDTRRRREPGYFEEVIDERAHLSADPLAYSETPTDRPNEAFCEECRQRVTIGPDGTEYGHAANNPVVCDVRPPGQSNGPVRNPREVS